MSPVESLALAPSSQVIASASIPFLAAPMWSATTATASSSFTTWRTPFTASALLSSTLASLPPKTGEMATVAIFMPGSLVSMPNTAGPIDLGGRVEPLGRRADELEILGVLERHLLRHRQPRGLRRELAIAELAPAGRMDDHALLGPAVARRHAPLIRRGGDQHVAGGGAGAAQRLPEAANGGRAPRHLGADQGIGIELVVRRCMLELDRGELHLELLGDEHGDGGIGALPHLHLRHDHCHLAAGVDANEGIRSEDIGCGLAIAPEHRQADTQQQPAAGGSTHLDEGAAAQAARAGPGDLINAVDQHGHSPLRQPLVEPAACLMAARMRR